MTFIKTGIQQPGIIELLFYKGNTGRALSNLANTLLLGPSNLTCGERELIASYVSNLNKCEFCHESHSAAANVHLNDSGKTVLQIKTNLQGAPISNKLKKLLEISAMVQQSGRNVTAEMIEAAKKAGASDEDIHDTVLIAAAFCMYNRYVDGLRTNLPKDKLEYLPMGKRMAKGYRYPSIFIRPLVIWLMKRKQKKITN